MDLCRDLPDPKIGPNLTQPTTTTFAAQHGLVLEGAQATGRDRRWQVTLSRSGIRREFTGEIEWVAPTAPQLGEVLAGLASEAADVEQTFTAEEWARYAGIRSGPDLSNRYRAAQRQAFRLCRWLPVGSYEVLLWDVMQG